MQRRTLTLSFHGNESEMVSVFFPPIELHGPAELSLLSLQSYNSKPNIDEHNNKFRVLNKATTVAAESNDMIPSEDDYLEIEVPVGSYELEDLAKYLGEQLKSYNVSFSLKPNTNTLKSEMKCDKLVDFTQDDSIGALLGFAKRKYEPNKLHKSDQLANINSLSCIRVECNIVCGSFINGRQSHTIHEFYPLVAPGYKIVETPSNLIYYPVSGKRIETVKIELKDENGRLINFRGEPITVRLHVRDGVAI